MENNFISNHFEDCHASCQDECDEYFMDMAIKEAQKGEGFAHPNPLVGAVIVKEGKILAKGYHHKYGDLHAERDALKNAAESNADVKGATIYVTLEPCCHTGKQPPCTQAIIQSGISRVVTGSKDPNPLVNGKGIEELKKAGIQVRENVLKDKCDALNEIFF
ncbi:MAG: bifunctional diaminohydroxyphosphoribosylaminopyrimidine deaminase/5-amino-6-(5-phosphoribosylamino)uracil reductase RibD, partial [Treponema sp.]|nr:bifunctional diaminohydroxyphosphoribosylaminopyrimidine deaminase/5-amino-6-(5-phosphoribosylamino)uracil reductase RibD [Treponema sp.]